jgi:molybdenum cofactor cytidylyltransferase
MVSAVITAAGRNRRMIEDLQSRGMAVKHKLLMDLQGESVIVRTIENVLKSGVEECVIVLGHFSTDISAVLDNFQDKRVKVIENPNYDVELSETLLNGVKNVKSGLCLCVAADQPTVTSETLEKLIKIAQNYETPENIVSILARRENGFLKSAEGLGMPLVCHSELLLKYLPGHQDNLNPLLREMIRANVVFYGLSAVSDLELVNINRYDDYLYIKKHLQ